MYYSRCHQENIFHSFYEYADKKEYHLNKTINNTRRNNLNKVGKKLRIF